MADTILTQEPEVNTTSDSHRDIMCLCHEAREDHVTSVVSSPNLEAQANHNRTPDKPRLRDILQNQPVLLKTVQVMRKGDGETATDPRKLRR